MEIADFIKAVHYSLVTDALIFTRAQS